MTKCLFKYFWIRNDKKFDQEFLINIVKKLGKISKDEPSLVKYKKSDDLTRGIAKINDEIKRENKRISKGQIKAFLGLHKQQFSDRMSEYIFGKKSYDVKVPFNAFEIFKKIIDLVCKSEELLRYCGYREGCLCRDKLIKDFWSLLQSEKTDLYGHQKAIKSKFRNIATHSCNNKHLK